MQDKVSLAGGVAVALLALLTAACAAPGPAVTPLTDPAQATAPSGPTLLLVTDGYELHYREGRVYQVVTRPDRLPSELREITSYDEFRDLYEVREGADLPAELPSEGVPVNGWRDQDCVRAGHACGRAPEVTPNTMIQLRLRFPTGRL